MLHKTSSRIKQFISPKKNEEIREDGDCSPNGVRYKRQLRPKSWICQDRKFTDGAFVWRINTSPAVQASSPPLRSLDFTQSSLSSFGTYDLKAPIISPPHSWSGFGTPSGAPKDLCLKQDESPLELVSPSRGHLILGSRSNLITTSPPPSTLVYDRDQTTSASQIDLLEALALEPGCGDDKISDREFRAMRNSKADGISKDVQQLMRETNFSHKGSSSALTNATTTSREWYQIEESSNLSTWNVTPRVEVRGQYREAVTGTVVLTNYKKTMQQEARKRTSVISTSETINEAMVDGMIELDHRRVENIDEHELKPSSDDSRSSRSGSTGSTPLEPFHLDDLPSRIMNAAGLLPERPRRQRPEIRRSIASTLAQDASVGPSSPTLSTETQNGAATDPSEDEIVLKSTPYSLTSSGFRHGDIRVSRRRRPKSATKSDTTNTARSSSIISHSTSDQAESSVARARDGEGAADEALDWPAFQIAISSATGYHWMTECEDCVADGPHPRIEDLEIKLDELLTWWSEFGLDAGRLVQIDLAAEKGRRGEVVSRGRRGAGAEPSQSVPEPLEMSQLWRVCAKGGDDDYDVNTAPYQGADREARGSEDGGDEEGEENHDGEVSLPPSPMQSIDPSTLAGQDDFVSMRFNVDHDLRDFLKWKSECVDSTIEGDM